MKTEPDSYAFIDAPHQGLTKREWLTGQALIGICANSDITKRIGELCAKTGKQIPAVLAQMATEQADESIANLNKTAGDQPIDTTLEEARKCVNRYHIALANNEDDEAATELKDLQKILNP